MGFKGSVPGFGIDILMPSHTCPHQQIPCALMMQVPVPQHLGSSVIFFQSKINKA
jgi:hypothetical protein